MCLSVSLERWCTVAKRLIDHDETWLAGMRLQPGHIVRWDPAHPLCWLRGPAVEHWSLADVLSLSCDRLVAEW